ncbi:MAG: YbaK/EbsC family protein [Planctomycetes bacterium]|nr:YbaK/EbsC family protein [Planctomycetota bacterium]
MNHLPAGVPDRLLHFLYEHNVEFEFVAPGVPMPTVLAAAAALGVSTDLILKTLLFVGDDGYVVAIANGTHRIDRSRLADAVGMRKPRPAKPDDVIAVTGYPAGGVAPLGLPPSVPVIVDAGTAALTFAYGGGGQEHLLLRVNVSDVIRCNNALVADITEGPKHTGQSHLRAT